MLILLFIVLASSAQEWGVYGVRPQVRVDLGQLLVIHRQHVGLLGQCVLADAEYGVVVAHRVDEHRAWGPWVALRGGARKPKEGQERMVKLAQDVLGKARARRLTSVKEAMYNVGRTFFCSPPPPPNLAGGGGSGGGSFVK